MNYRDLFGFHRCVRRHVAHLRSKADWRHVIVSVGAVVAAALALIGMEGVAVAASLTTNFVWLWEME